MGLTDVSLLAAVLTALVLWAVASYIGRRPAGSRTAPSVAEGLPHAPDPFLAAREYAVSCGGGAFLGVQGARWVCADREHAVLVLGPPRSGKTSAVVIPALLASPGAAVSTSTKPDVLAATLAARRAAGEVWLFDPSGEHEAGGLGARVLSWSPVAAARSWDEALLTARAMTLAAPAVGRGTQHEQHWSERAAALLAPLLFAAQRSGGSIELLLRWVLRHELEAPERILKADGADLACDVLVGIAKTDGRERSSIFSATAGVLALYNSDAARAAGATPNFDADVFVGSTDTVFVTAPAHRQALCAPLVVGLLEQIRHATYRRAAIGERGVPVFFCLDEVANIAPIHDLPALVSEAGGQGLHVMACLQDLSQARERWGDAAADGFLSLFQTKLFLPGVSDPRTLEALSLVLGEYDRPLQTRTVGVSSARTKQGWNPPTKTTTMSDSIAYHTTRQRRMPPGEIAAIRPGSALLVRGAASRRLRTTPFYASQPWRTLAAGAAGPQRGLLRTNGEAIYPEGALAAGLAPAAIAMTSEGRT